MAKDKLFFDTETTGLNAAECGMIEIAMMRTTPDGRQILDEYEARIVIEPHRYRVEPRALEVNQHSSERWADAQPLPKVLNEIRKRMNNTVQLVGHNVHFDCGFVDESFKREGQKPPETYYHKSCTVSLAAPMVDLGLVPNVKLTTLSHFFGIEHGGAHTAMSDVRATKGVYFSILERFYRGKVAQAPV